MYYPLVHRNTSVLRKLELSLRASLCVLYSIVVSDGKLKCFLIVSLHSIVCQSMLLSKPFSHSHLLYLILRLILPSEEVLFHTEMISSEPLMDKTAPQISSFTSNWSPMIAKTNDSQYLLANPFLTRTIHFPPLIFTSSYIHT